MRIYPRDIVTLYAYRAHNGQVRVLYSGLGSAPAPPGGESNLISQVGINVRDTTGIHSILDAFFGAQRYDYWIIENEEDINVTLQRIGAMIND